MSEDAGQAKNKVRCRRCTALFRVPGAVAEKIGLYAGADPSKAAALQSRLDLLCDDCGRCFACLSRAPRPRAAFGDNKGSGNGIECTGKLARCAGCGFHYHEAREGGAERCCKCDVQKRALAMENIVGTEVPVLERRLRRPTADVIRRVREEVKRHSAAKPRDRAASKISEVILGDRPIKPLFSSPYPEEYIRSGALFICKRCLSYFTSRFVYSRHLLKCASPFPPGKLLYYDPDRLGIFEVNGLERKTYCQNLCLLSKMFLDHKTLYYDVESFLFYVLGTVESSGEFTIHGYFSKEFPDSANNLSCIVVLPAYQQAGLGSLLIDFSYHLSRLKGPPYTSGPEEPLSAQGAKAYMGYWADSLVRYVLSHRHFRGSDEDFAKISEHTGIPAHSLKEAHGSLRGAFGKTPLFPDFLTRRDRVKKTRRIRPEGLLQVTH